MIINHVPRRQTFMPRIWQLAIAVDFIIMAVIASRLLLA